MFFQNAIVLPIFGIHDSIRIPALKIDVKNACPNPTSKYVNQVYLAGIQSHSETKLININIFNIVYLNSLFMLSQDYLTLKFLITTNSKDIHI